MTDNSDLIDRLRAACVGYPRASIAWPHRILHEAADALSSQSLSLSEAREEIERLREALKPFALVTETNCKLFRYSATGWNEADMTADCARARSALENGPAGLADATSNPPLSDLSSLRKGAEVAVIEAMENDPFWQDAPLAGTTQQDQRIRHYAEVAIAALVSGSREEQS